MTTVSGEMAHRRRRAVDLDDESSRRLRGECANRAIGRRSFQIASIE
jgi:hypothetical protein